MITPVSSILPTTTMRFAGHKPEELFVEFFEWLKLQAVKTSSTHDFMQRRANGKAAFSMIEAADAYCKLVALSHEEGKGQGLEKLLTTPELIENPTLCYTRMSRFVCQRLRKCPEGQQPFESFTPAEVRARDRFRRSVSATQKKNARHPDFNLRHLSPEARAMHAEATREVALRAARDVTHPQFKDPALTALIQKLLPLQLANVRQKRDGLPVFSPLAWLEKLVLGPELAEAHPEIAGLAESLSARKSPLLTPLERSRLRRHCFTVSNDPAFPACKFVSVLKPTGAGKDRRRSLDRKA